MYACMPRVAGSDLHSPLSNLAQSFFHSPIPWRSRRAPPGQEQRQGQGQEQEQEQGQGDGQESREGQRWEWGRQRLGAGRRMDLVYRERERVSDPIHPTFRSRRRKVRETLQTYAPPPKMKEREVRGA